MRSIIELIDALDVRKRILIIGSAFVDVIVHVPRLPLSGEDVEGSSRQQVVGGCAYNAADAVATHPALAAVCVEDAHHAVRTRRLRSADADDAVRTNGKMPPGQFFGARRRTHLRIDVGRGKML